MQNIARLHAPTPFKVLFSSVDVRFAVKMSAIQVHTNTVFADTPTVSGTSCHQSSTAIKRLACVCFSHYCETRGDWHGDETHPINQCKHGLSNQLKPALWRLQRKGGRLKAAR